MIQRRLLRLSQASIRRHVTIQRFNHSYPSSALRVAPFTDKLSPRCYSTATETPTQSSAEAPPPSGEINNNENSTPESQLEIDLSARKKEVIDLKDKYLRSVAEFRNLQDRTKRDIDTARSFAISRFASDLIESVDNIDRALDTVPAEKIASKENPELVNLYEGLKMTETILMQTLEKHGLQRFDPSANGEKFNPNMHEATFQTKVEGKEDGDVFMTQQKGFSLNGRVVRAAKVGVVKNS